MLMSLPSLQAPLPNEGKIKLTKTYHQNPETKQIKK